jgi:hypothetical protein
MLDPLIALSITIFSILWHCTSTGPFGNRPRVALSIFTTSIFQQQGRAASASSAP